MSTLSSHLLEPAPTVLEIRGFTPEATATLKQAFIDNLQQPSYVAHAVVIGSDSARQERNRYVSSLQLACPIGFALTARAHWYESRIPGFTVGELTPCCLAEARGMGQCSSCRRPLAVTPLTDSSVYPLQKLASEEEQNEDNFLASGMEKFESRLERRLQAIPDVNILSASFIAFELTGLLFELARYNSTALD